MTAKEFEKNTDTSNHDAKQFWMMMKVHDSDNAFFINKKSEKVLTVLKDGNFVVNGQSQFVTPNKVI